MFWYVDHPMQCTHFHAMASIYDYHPEFVGKWTLGDKSTDRKSIGWPSMDDQIHVQMPKLILDTNILLEHILQKCLNPVRRHSHLRRLKMGLFDFYDQWTFHGQSLCGLFHCNPYLCWPTVANLAKMLAVSFKKCNFWFTLLTFQHFWCLYIVADLIKRDRLFCDFFRTPVILSRHPVVIQVVFNPFFVKKS